MTPELTPPPLLCSLTSGKVRNSFGSRRDEDVFLTMNPLRCTVHRAYQWLQGHDIRVAADETPTVGSMRLVCATHSCAFAPHSERHLLRIALIRSPRARVCNRPCPFTVTALYTVFTEPPVKDMPGFYINEADFHPKHNHSPRYIPMNREVENARRANLRHDDPSLEDPPLDPVHGFAGSDSDKSESESGRVAPGAGAGFASTVASRATPSTSSAAGGASGDYEPVASPSGSRQYSVYQTGAGAGPAAFPSATHIGAAATAAAGTGSIPAQAQVTALGIGVGGTLYAAAAPPLPFQGAAFASGSGSAHSAVGSTAPFPPPSPPASSSRNNELSELQQFLLEISPAFTDYFQFFDDVIPLDTSVDRLLALDDGADRIFRLFREVPGLPLLHAAMASDGVRKAKMRKAKNPSSATLDPRIAIGMPRAEAEKWVQDRMKDGQEVLEQEAAAAAAAAAW
jgi:hypothetical protein